MLADDDEKVCTEMIRTYMDYVAWTLEKLLYHSDPHKGYTEYKAYRDQLHEQYRQELAQKGM